MDTISDIIVNVKNKKYDFVRYTTHNQKTIDKNFITIVMTTHNRKEQTLYSLHSFTTSQLHDRITVIIVDDSTEEFLTTDQLSQFPFQITYIMIDNDKKKWINPCVNYNIGFQEVKTNKVIIQNAEVCHCGDVIKYVEDHVNNQNYLVFDVCAIPSLNDNHDFYQLNGHYETIYSRCPSQYKWYQHMTFNRNYHFLSAMTTDNLFKLDGFDYDFSVGSCYDDDELIFRIQNVLKLNIHNVFTERTRLLGIHQWHPQGKLTYNAGYVHINLRLCENKKAQFNQSQQWVTGQMKS